MRLAILLAGLIAAAALPLAAGCGGRAVPHARYTDVWVSESPDDSLGLAAFLKLPPTVAASRRVRAGHFLVRASRAPDTIRRLRCLSTAAGLAPDDPATWMDLSEETSRLGNKLLALDQLDAAEAAIMLLDAEDRRALRLRTAVARAWISRDRAKWVDAHAWADSAARYSPAEREIVMLLGLTRASHGDLRGAFNISRDIERKHFFHFEWRWMRGMAELARGNAGNAYHWLHDARPDGDYAARFYRDLAMVCERIGKIVEARRFHGYGFTALGLEPDVCPEPRDVTIGYEVGKALRVPVWTSLGRYYAAGSLYGATVAAVDSFYAAADAAGRHLWADQAEDLLSICIRQDLEEGYCRRQRGRIFAAMGLAELALEDMRRVVAALEGEGWIDPSDLALYGHLLNTQGAYQQALPYLRKAVDAQPDLAQGWSALGYALLMTAQGAAGERALDRALVLDPDLPEAWYNRGLAHFHAHRWGAAASDFERALDLAPGNRDEILPLLQQSRGRARRAERDEGWE
ncbi:tetratricopeptide repeat protein [bacterium]|nr:tetratricopeptide repeat protein [bacterium]MBU1073298.1 tetratricopeptide repeat protein [bacterium]MBU1676125.1 tetratricopeptide repeat protein [bacterium]